jgi:hypothetical protein
VPAASVNVAVECGQNDGSIDGDPDVGYVADDPGPPEVDISEAAENVLRARWANITDVRDDSSDEDLADEDLAYPILEDDEPEPGFVDWEAIEANFSLSAWDQLGEGYERDVAAIGPLQYIIFSMLH